MTHWAELGLLAANGVPRGVLGALLAAGLAGGAILLCFLLLPRIAGTTLVSPWLWCLAALAALGGIESIFQLQPAEDIPLWLSAARFMAAALSLCPLVSVLGAKRPQHRAWNFVVLSLWGVVSLPSLLSLLLGRGAEFQLADLRGLILWVLIALPAVNYLPTRHAAGALLVVVGQVVLLAPHLPLIGRPVLATDPGLVALFCFSSAALVVLSTRGAGSGNRNSLDNLWCWFRDRFGLFWGLRLQERINAAARQYDWPFYLAWGGFRRTDDHQPLAKIPAAQERQLRQTLRGLLRRFASPRVIAVWLPDGIH